MKKSKVKKRLATCEEAQLVLQAENLFLRNKVELLKSEADILCFLVEHLSKENTTLRTKLEKSFGKKAISSVALWPLPEGLVREPRK